MLTDFSLATFNLFNFVEPPLAYYDINNIYDDKQWQQKCQWTADLIQQMQVDILALQEVFSPEPLQQLCAQQGLDGFVCSGKAQFDHAVGTQPQLALATRFVIEHSCNMKPDRTLAQTVGLPANFQFSRSPLKVKVRIPDFGALWVVVLHLKSPRPAWQASELPLLPDPILNQQLGEQVFARWGSARQRSAEAALVYFDVIKQWQQDDLPVVILGDFNSELDGELTFLLNKTAQGYGFSDPRTFIADPTAEAATHYWGAKGSRLDHILVSDHFVPEWQHSLAEVSKMQVWDRHLRFADPERDRMASDHAPVQIWCRVRS